MSIPYVENQRAVEMTDFPDDEVDTQTKGDLLVNNLIYRQPKALSLAKARTFVKQFFQRSDYPSAAGKTAICDWNTGSSYIDPYNSFLTFSVKTTGGVGSFSFERGSSMNLINRLQVRSRSGTELERIDDANLWSYLDLNYSQSDEYLKTIGSLMGHGVDTANHLTYSIGASVKFAIPLIFLCPLFRPLKKQLIPPQMGSGLHFEMTFEAVNTAFISTSSITSYDITDIEFYLDTVELSDDTQKTLNMESANTGLEWVSPRIYTSVTSLPAGQTSTSIQLRKAVSQAMSAYCIPRRTSDINDQTEDSFSSAYGGLSQPIEYQYRVGSLFFPNQVVRENSTISNPESYINALTTWDKNKHQNYPCSVSMKNFMQDLGIFACTLSKNDSLHLAGLPLNNSRALELNLSFPDAGPVERTLTLFLEYIQVSKFYSQNVSVAI